LWFESCCPECQLPYKQSQKIAQKRLALQEEWSIAVSVMSFSGLPRTPAPPADGHCGAAVVKRD
jgi:hypothetical protein